MVDNALIGTTEFDIFSLNPATCAENWRTHLDYPGALLPSNRGAAYMDGMLFRGTQDARVLAFDFKTGKQLWETSIADPKHGESVPSAPIAWDGLVFIGNSGGDYKGGKGHVFALDGKTGKIVWEFFLAPQVEGDEVRGPLSTTPLDMARPGITRQAYPSAAPEPGPPTPSISKTGCCTSREAIRLPTSLREPGKEAISIPIRSWCSTPRPATTRTISRWCRRTGTTMTSPTRPSCFRRWAASRSCRSRRKTATSTAYDLADNNLLYRVPVDHGRE